MQQPNLGLSGKLAEETLKLPDGTILKYSEPPESRPPDKRWRLYVFKGDTMLEEPYQVHRQAWYLFGRRDGKVADVPLDHPSVSKQHAVLQYR